MNMLISKNERKKEGVCVWVSVGVFGCVHVEREREREREREMAAHHQIK